MCVIEPRPLVFSRPSGGKVLVKIAVVERLLMRRQLHANAPESGGIMLGRMIDGGSDVCVDVISEPTASDRAGRHFFHRSRQPTQAAIVKAWRASDGTRNYLGEWHTHPEGEPTPSQVDLRGWRLLCAESTIEQDYLLFLIVGLRTIVLWEVSLVRGLEAPCRFEDGER